MQEKIGYKTIIKQKEFMKLVIASIINRFGDSLDAIAFTWLVYQLTESASLSALIFGVNKLPSIIVTPLAGAWIEGRNKKVIMIATDLIRGICVACIATGYLLQILQPWMLIMTTIIISTAEAFRGPASTAMLPKLLKVEYYEYGMSLMSSLSSVVEIVGMAIGAGVIAMLGISGAIYIDMITFVLSAVIIMTLQTCKEEKIMQKFIVKEYMQELLEGFKYLKRNEVEMFFTMTTVFLNAVLVPFNSLQAPLVQEVIHREADILSILGIALTVGMMAGTMIYPMIAKLFQARTIFFAGGGSIGLYYVGLILCEPLYSNPIFTYAFVIVTSLMVGVCIAIFMSFLQIEFIKNTKEEYLARLSGISTAFGALATPVVSFVISAIVQNISTQHVFLITGIIDVCVCGMLLFHKVFRKYDNDVYEECVE